MGHARSGAHSPDCRTSTCAQALAGGGAIGGVLSAQAVKSTIPCLPLRPKRTPLRAAQASAPDALPADHVPIFRTPQSPLQDYFHSAKVPHFYSALGIFRLATRHFLEGCATRLMSLLPLLVQGEA